MRKKKVVKKIKKARSDTSYKKRRVKKAAKKTVTRVPKTRNYSTMTEAQFFQMIRSALRTKSRWWKPRLKCLDSARRAYSGLNKRMKWEFQCYKCKKYFPRTQVEAHHTVPVGSLNSFDDLPGFAKRLFSEDGWECVCKGCHKKEHSKEKLK